VFTAGKYKVTLVVANKDSFSKIINILAVTKPVITTPANALCAGYSTILSTTTFKKYKWSTGDSIQSIKIKKGGSYAVTVLDSDGCYASSTPVNIVFHPLPSVPAISLTINDSLTSSAANGNQWYIL